MMTQRGFRDVFNELFNPEKVAAAPGGLGSGPVGRNVMPAATPVDANLAAELLASNPGNTRAIKDGLAARNSMDLNNTIALDFVETQNQARETPYAVAKTLKERAFPGASIKYLQEKIEEVVTKGKGTISPALAGRILAKSQGQQAPDATWDKLGEQLGKVVNWLPIGAEGNRERDMGDGQVIDHDKMDQFINEAKDPRIMDTVELLQERQTQIAQREGLQNELNFAQQQLIKAQALADAGDPRVRPETLESLQRRVKNALVQLGLNSATVTGNKKLTYNGAEE